MKVRMRRTVAVIFGFAMAASGCAGDARSATPAGPSAPTVTALDISGIMPTLPSFQLVATAHLSNGTTEDVSSRATWQTSNSQVATVSATGLVTVVSNGDIDLRAAYQGATGSAHVTLSVTKAATLSGVVADAAAQPIGAARVQIIGGDHALTDDRGTFTLSGVRAGRVLVEFTKDGYQTLEQEVALDHDLQVTITLLRSGS